MKTIILQPITKNQFSHLHSSIKALTVKNFLLKDLTLPKTLRIAGKEPQIVFHRIFIEDDAYPRLQTQISNYDIITKESNDLSDISTTAICSTQADNTKPTHNIHFCDSIKTKDKMIYSGFANFGSDLIEGINLLFYRLVSKLIQEWPKVLKTEENPKEKLNNDS